MRKGFKILVFVLLTNVAFGGVLSEPTNTLDKCLDFEKEVQTVLAEKHILFSEEKGKEAKDKDGNQYISFKNSSADQTVRLYTFKDERKAYNELKNSLTDNVTPLAKYENIKQDGNFEQSIELLPSFVGFNCYIKKGNELWIALYPYGKKSEDEKKNKKTVAIIQNGEDRTQMYFYQNPPKSD